MTTYQFECDACRRVVVETVERGRLPAGWGFRDVIVEREHGRRMVESELVCAACGGNEQGGVESLERKSET